MGWIHGMSPMEKNTLADIVEFGASVTCYLHISDKDGNVLDIVEVFQIDDEGRVKEIWAL